MVHGFTHWSLRSQRHVAFILRSWISRCCFARYKYTYREKKIKLLSIRRYFLVLTNDVHGTLVDMDLHTGWVRIRFPRAWKSFGGNATRNFIMRFSRVVMTAWTRLCGNASTKFIGKKWDRTSNVPLADKTLLDMKRHRGRMYLWGFQRGAAEAPGKFYRGSQSKLSWRRGRAYAEAHEKFVGRKLGDLDPHITSGLQKILRFPF